MAKLGKCGHKPGSRKCTRMTEGKSCPDKSCMGLAKLAAARRSGKANVVCSKPWKRTGGKL